MVRYPWTSDLGTYATPDIRPGDVFPTPDIIFGDLPPPSQDIRLGDPPLASDGDHWRLVQTCSFVDLPPRNDIWWWQLKLKPVQFRTGEEIAPQMQC